MLGAAGGGGAGGAVGGGGWGGGKGGGVSRGGRGLEEVQPRRGEELEETDKLKKKRNLRKDSHIKRTESYGTATE